MNEWRIQDKDMRELLINAFEKAEKAEKGSKIDKYIAASAIEAAIKYFDNPADYPPLTKKEPKPVKPKKTKRPKQFGAFS